MGKVTSVLFVGVGGQGVLKSSDILARAAFVAGLDVKKSEIHGMSQRGGGVTSTVRFGEKVYSPLAGEAGVDILVGLDRAEGEKYLSAVCPGGKALFVDDGLLAKVPDRRFANTAILGRLADLLDFSREIWHKSISLEVPERFVEGNLKAFEAGRG